MKSDKRIPSNNTLLMMIIGLQFQTIGLQFISIAYQTIDVFYAIMSILSFICCFSLLYQDIVDKYGRKKKKMVEETIFEFDEDGNIIRE